jgi:hypothetical protein
VKGEKRRFKRLTQKKEVLWILDLIGKEQADGLQAMLSSVDIIPQEDIISIGWESAVLEKTK